MSTHSRDATVAGPIAVVGCGHVGLVTAACLAQSGYSVTGIDIDAERIERFARGDIPFREPGLEDLVQSNLAAGRLRFCNSFEAGLRDACFAFLCVSTPATPSGAADLRHIRAAAAAIASVMAGCDQRPIIVNKSTSPIGTAETIEGILARALTGLGQPPAIVSNPEFLREGHAVEDFFHPSRIVVGSHDAEAARAVAALYRDMDAPVLVTDVRTAEMIKYVSNAFLATRLSFINEVARLCESLAIDVTSVISGVALDGRIGAAFFQPGIGYGGSCLPKDTAALCHVGEAVGVTMRVVDAAREANASQRMHAVNSIRWLAGGLEDRVIGVWGITFKGGTDDLRDSPALDVVGLLRNEGATVRAYDPAFAAGSLSGVVDVLAGTPVEAAAGCDVLAVLTDWDEFRAIDLGPVAGVLRGPALYDGRNVIDPAAAEEAGLTYYGVGRAPLWRGRAPFGGAYGDTFAAGGAA